jgi:hypothetical protein
MQINSLCVGDECQQFHQAWDVSAQNENINLCETYFVRRKFFGNKKRELFLPCAGGVFLKEYFYAVTFHIFFFCAAIRVEKVHL